MARNEAFIAELKNTLRENLKALIEERTDGREQNKIASEVGITASALSGYLDASKEMRVSTLVKLANYFQAQTDYLLGLTKYKNPQRQDIGEEVGLSDRAIENLIDASSGDTIKMSQYKKITVCDYLIKNMNGDSGNLLENLYDCWFPEFGFPVPENDHEYYDWEWILFGTNDEIRGKKPFYASEISHIHYAKATQDIAKIKDKIANAAAKRNVAAK